MIQYLRNRYTSAIIYAIINGLSRLSKWLESSFWGYKWCKQCGGAGIYPNSGMWDQPDGYKLCPRCRGHRWEHVAKCFKGDEHET